jgi:hypothetical protein
MDDNSDQSIKDFYKHTRKLLKPQKNKFNAAISAFVV